MEAAVWGNSPVRTIGGWSNVDIAVRKQVSAQSRHQFQRVGELPFCPDSAIDPRACEGSSGPPRLCKELAVDPLRGVYLRDGIRGES